MDLLQREGKYPIPATASPILGVEFAGVVESLGSGADEANSDNNNNSDDFQPGDQVFGLAYGGAYAEYIAVSTAMLMHRPPEISAETAAGIPETWMTATQAMYLIGGFSPGKTILWHAGASSVSIAGIQLSVAEGAAGVYVTAGSEEKIEFCCKELGASSGWNYRTQDWVQGVREVTAGGKGGVDVVVDMVGASHFQGDLDVVGRDGRVVLLGMMSGTRTPEGVDLGAFVSKRVRVEGSSLRR